MKKIFILGFIVPFLLVGIAFADPVVKIVWCHVEPNGNQETLELPIQALTQAGHVDANGNPLHAGDHAGACITTPTISPTPSASPVVTPSPTSTPSATITPVTTGDGKSDGRSSCPECTQAPKSPYDGQPVGWK